jgi:RecJ-like exonuclease
MTQGLIQYKTDYQTTLKIREQQYFENYVNSYIESALKATCKCSKCQAQAIQVIKIQRTKQGVVEVWHCSNCDRFVERKMDNSWFVARYNEERKQAITA